MNEMDSGQGTATLAAERVAAVRETRAAFAPGADETSDEQDAGLSVYVLAKPDAPDSLRGQADELGDILLDLVGIAAAHVDRIARREEKPALRYDVDLWVETLTHLPLLGFAPVDESSESWQSRPGTVPKELVQEALNQGERLSPERAFRRFVDLQERAVTQGAVRFPVRFNVILVWMEVALAEVGSEPMLLPGVRLRLGSISRTPEKGRRIDLVLRTSAAPFDTGALRDPEVREEFESFLRETPRKDIARSDRFFEGTLPRTR